MNSRLTQRYHRVAVTVHKFNVRLRDDDTIYRKFPQYYTVIYGNDDRRYN